MNDFGLPKISEKLEKEEFEYRNKYRNIYIRLIIKCQGMTEEELSGYNEKHHILPKCMGGTNDKENIVLMPVRYHMMAHMLLVIIYPGIRGLKYAIKAVLEGSSRIVDRAGIAERSFSSKTLAYFRETSKIKQKKEHPNWGKHLSEETKRKISESSRGKKMSEETRKKMSMSHSGSKNPNYGKKFSEEARRNMSKSHKGYITSEETKAKLRVALSGENNPNWKKKFSKEEGKRLQKNFHIENYSGANNPRAKKVIGPDGTIYSWTGEASEKSGIPKSTLQKWLRGECRSNNGWKYYTEDD